MVVVAVAGGTGAVGRTVLDAVAKSGEHTAIVLSRTVSSLVLLALCNYNIILMLFRQLPQAMYRNVLLLTTAKSTR